MPAYTSAIITAAVIGFLGLLLWAAQREKPKTDPETHTLVFRHSTVFRWFSLFAAFGIPLGITVLVIFFPPKNKGEVWAILGSYSMFAVLSVPLLWESMRFAVTTSPEGLDCRSPWRRGRFISWDNLESISFSTFGWCFLIRAKDGWKFQVTIFVPGLSVFLEQCEHYLPLKRLQGAKLGYTRVGRPFPEEDDEAD